MSPPLVHIQSQINSIHAPSLYFLKIHFLLLSGGPGIDSRWCHWGFFSVVPPTEPCALWSTQPLKVSTMDISWGKGGRYVWLTNYHSCSAETLRKSGALIYPETPWATLACRGRPLLFIFYILLLSSHLRLGFPPYMPHTPLAILLKPIIQGVTGGTDQTSGGCSLC